MNTADVVAIVLVYVVVLIVVLFILFGFGNKNSQTTTSTGGSGGSSTCNSPTYVYATASGKEVTLSNSNTTALFSNTTSVNILISACPNDKFTVQHEVLCIDKTYLRLISNTYTNYYTNSSGSVQFVVPAAGGACITNIYITGPGITKKIHISVTNT